MKPTKSRGGGSVSTIDSIMGELLAASPWRRQELLESHARMYGEGFAATLRAELEAKLEQQRKNPDWNPKRSRRR